MTQVDGPTPASQNNVEGDRVREIAIVELNNKPSSCIIIKL